MKSLWAKIVDKGIPAVSSSDSVGNEEFESSTKAVLTVIALSNVVKCAADAQLYVSVILIAGDGLNNKQADHKKTAAQPVSSKIDFNEKLEFDIDYLLGSKDLFFTVEIIDKTKNQVIANGRTRDLKMFMKDVDAICDVELWDRNCLLDTICELSIKVLGEIY
jgi:hypothetical protein